MTAASIQTLKQIKCCESWVYSIFLIHKFDFKVCLDTTLDTILLFMSVVSNYAAQATTPGHCLLSLTPMH